MIRTNMLVQMLASQALKSFVADVMGVFKGPFFQFKSSIK